MKYVGVNSLSQRKASDSDLPALGASGLTHEVLSGDGGTGWAALACVRKD